ncbi:hypothetical protein [Thermaerobacillus caldiproteolyticus]|nr:hypothetical protein [Anoxybacillus caldiproteolyticus]QPA31618.1 hypothetical protein ISX45_00920 [Anoxybacillus caldiproteolyticus]
MQIIRETATHIQKWDEKNKRVVMELKEKATDKKTTKSKASTKEKVDDE